MRTHYLRELQSSALSRADAAEALELLIYQSASDATYAWLTWLADLLMIER